MPKAKLKGRGRVLRTRTVKVDKDHYMSCDVVEKEGPRGGRTVCSRVKTKKGRR